MSGRWARPPSQGAGRHELRQTSRTSWATGDFNGDGKVDVNDLTVVLSHFGQSAGASVAAGRRAGAVGLVVFGPRAARAAAVARRRQLR